MSVTDKDRFTSEFLGSGERLVPGFAPEKWFEEHLQRYALVGSYISPKKRILDVACGVGYGAAYLGYIGGVNGNVKGIDLDLMACRYAREVYKVNASVANADAIPLQSNSFDIIVSFETIEHLPAPLQFIAECSRLLVKGGMFFVSTPNAFLHPKELNPYHLQDFYVDDLTNKLKASGFMIKNRWGQTLYPLRALIRPALRLLKRKFFRPPSNNLKFTDWHDNTLNELTPVDGYHSISVSALKARAEDLNVPQLVKIRDNDLVSKLRFQNYVVCCEKM